MSATVHIDEIRWYLRFVNPRATADELAAWMGVTGSGIFKRLHAKGRVDIVDRLVRNAADKGHNVAPKKRAA